MKAAVHGWPKPAEFAVEVTAIRAYQPPSAAVAAVPSTSDMVRKPMCEFKGGSRFSQQVAE